MKLYFLVSSSNQMVDDVRRGCITTGATEPFSASQTLDYTRSVMDAAVSAKVVSMRLDNTRSIIS